MYAVAFSAALNGLNRSRAAPNQKRRPPLAEQLFGMYVIHIHCIVFVLYITEKKNQKKEEGTNLEFSGLVNLTLKKVSRTYRVDLAIE